uniref:AT3G52170-like helix-turn-helix domain-containing protein n=1 Tax=Rhizophora mucronata TaxID=61149 RepID=A0A2P2K2C0_RHIMU
MHAVKGGWVGQTFALSKGNGSEGRKSRIRRSKEERKEMVESFIKKYQSLNNGNFPSLNLTHKEVGGSFYIVREIVREIIQENRVLGPAKSFSEEQTIDLLLEQKPLGTISIEPLTSLHLSANGTPLVSEPHQSTDEEHDTVSIGVFDKPEQHGFDNGQIINGNSMIVETEESDKPKVVAQLIEPLEAEKTFERAKVTQMEDVMVETFPLRPVAKPTDYFDESSVDVEDSNETSEDKFEKVHPPSGNDSSLSNGISSSVNSSLVAGDKVQDLVSPMVERNANLVDENTLENVRDSSLEISNSSSTVHDIHQEISQCDKAIAETEVSFLSVVVSELHCSVH